ncbi:MAG: 3-oxoacyl-ACP reductase FabG [Chloroflexi bacterium]|nr:3-oxoacyl-ACP reductase FabG [Chloroflexota bacterium]
MRLKGKVAIVTGSSRGIGKAVAIQFAREGAHVAVVASRDATAAEKVGNAIKDAGPSSLAGIFMVDVSQRSAVNSMVQQILEKLGRIDILVNNAGIIHPTHLWEIPEEQWDQVIGVHLKGTFNCTQAVIKNMMERKSGKIINVTAPSALRASSAGVADYASAKGGIIAFTKTAAKELASFHINVNCVCPVANTRMTDSLMQFRHATREEHANRYPLGWFAEPEEMAPPFVFFASSDSDYVTGQVLAVDGGLTM